MNTSDSITIPSPDDWHCHLREGPLMRAVAPIAGKIFARVVAMPNLSTPVTSGKLAREYKQDILAAYPDFEPLVACYLQESTNPRDVLDDFERGDVFSLKYYPKGATTLSSQGVQDWRACSAVFSAMEEADIPLMIHGEVTAPLVDIFDRESQFLDTVLTPILKQHKKLRIVLEHLTTKDAVDFVQYADHPIAATITAHHLVLTRTDLLSSGIHPHYFCYPIVKTHRDQKALRTAATAGNPRFMLGTDSAPHPDSDKHCSTGKAGIFSSPTALAIYAQVFAEEHALHHLGNFASSHGSKFHNLPTNTSTISLTRREKPMSFEHITYQNNHNTPETITVFQPPGGLFWSIHQNHKKETLPS